MQNKNKNTSCRVKTVFKTKKMELEELLATTRETLKKERLSSKNYAEANQKLTAANEELEEENAKQKEKLDALQAEVDSQKSELEELRPLREQMNELSVTNKKLTQEASVKDALIAQQVDDNNGLTMLLAGRDAEYQKLKVKKLEELLNDLKGNE